MLGCDECDYKTQRNDRLNEHKRMIHQGVRYNRENDLILGWRVYNNKNQGFIKFQRLFWWTFQTGPG